MPAAPETIVASTPRLKLAGAAVDEAVADRVVGLEVHVSTRQYDRVQLRIDASPDPDGKVLLEQPSLQPFKIGAELGVSLTGGDASATEVFKGPIVAVGVQVSANGSVLVVEAADKGHKLRSGATPETWLETKASDIVTAIAGEHGLTADVSATTTVHDYVARAVTDHALIEQLARQLGWEWWTHAGKLHFRPPPPVGAAPVRLTNGENLLSVAVSYDGRDTASGVKVRSWDPVNSAEVLGTQATPDTGTGLGSDATFATDRHEEAVAELGGEVTVGNVHAISQTVAEEIAKGVSQRLLEDRLRLEATTYGDPNLRPGEWVQLDGLGEQLAGKYYVTDVIHRWGPGEDLLTDVVGARTGRVLQPWDTGLVPPGTNRLSSLGPVPAVVTDVDDADGGMGRVKVKFPTLGEELGSTWARVVAPGAGKDRGLDLRPRVDDEVLVVFSHGDHALPYVLGGLWSKTHTHADKNGIASKKSVRDSLRSEDGALVTLHRKDEPASHAGHEHPREWADLETAARLEGAVSLRSKTDSGVLVADAVVVSTVGKEILLTNGEATIRMAANGDITIEGQSLTVDVKADATVNAKGDAKIDAVNLEFTGKSNATVKGTNVTVDGAAGIKVKSGKIDMGP